MTKPATVDAYLDAQPQATRELLDVVRATLRKALPDAEEVISYQIPAYRLPGGVALFFAGWKKHWSLYPAGKDLVAAFREDLAPYKVNERGTVRFPLDKPVPVDLVARIAAFRRRELG